MLGRMIHILGYGCDIDQSVNMANMSLFAYIRKVYDFINWYNFECLIILHPLE